MPTLEELGDALERARRARDRVTRQAWERFRRVKASGGARTMPRSIMARLTTAELLATRARALAAMLREAA